METMAINRPMRTTVAIVCATLIGLATLPQAFAQQKTIKACEDEWRANKADNQAKGITQKAYVTQCRASDGSSQTTPAPAAAAPAAAAPTAIAPAAKPAPVAAAPTAIAPAARPAPAATATPTGTNQFVADSQAKARCPSDTVVWVNLESGIYHFAGYKDYGQTKKGAYMCEGDTAAASFRAAKNEKHP